MPSLEGDATPTPLRCAACLYDLSGLPDGPCPECGRAFGEVDRTSHARFAQWLAALPNAQRSTARRSAAVIVLVSTAIAAAQGVIAGLYTAVLLLAHVILTVVIGLACSLAVKRWQRDAFMAIWLRHLWWVHLPWLCVPAGVVFVAILGALVRELATDAGLAISLMLLQPWIALVIMSLIGFPGMLSGDTERAGIRRPMLTGACLLGALVCVAGSAGVGLLGGAWLISKVLVALA